MTSNLTSLFLNKQLEAKTLKLSNIYPKINTKLSIRSKNLFNDFSFTLNNFSFKNQIENKELQLIINKTTFGSLLIQKYIQLLLLQKKKFFSEHFGSKTKIKRQRINLTVF